jgi:hypothetical protein
MNSNVVQVGDVVYKKLPEEDADALVAIVSKASQLGLGPEYLGTAGGYFLTKFYEGVEPMWDAATETLMNNILDSELRYHPDFWFKNLVRHPNGRYLAIDWEQRGTDWRGASREVRKDIMFERYNFMLEGWKRANPPAFEGSPDDAFLLRF